VAVNNKVLEEIKQFSIDRLKDEYGYCGVADSNDCAMLNSGGQGEIIKIIIEYEQDEA